MPTADDSPILFKEGYPDQQEYDQKVAELEIEFEKLRKSNAKLLCDFKEQISKLRRNGFVSFQFPSASPNLAPQTYQAMLTDRSRNVEAVRLRFSSESISKIRGQEKKSKVERVTEKKMRRSNRASQLLNKLSSNSIKTKKQGVVFYSPKSNEFELSSVATLKNNIGEMSSSDALKQEKVVEAVRGVFSGGRKIEEKLGSGNGRADSGGGTREGFMPIRKDQYPHGRKKISQRGSSRHDEKSYIRRKFKSAKR